MPHAGDCVCMGHLFLPGGGNVATLLLLPKDTTNSQLVWSIEATHGRPRMPPIGRTQLTTNQINGLKRWILEGAKNN